MFRDETPLKRRRHAKVSKKARLDHVFTPKSLSIKRRYARHPRLVFGIWGGHDIDALARLHAPIRQYDNERINKRRMSSLVRRRRRPSIVLARSAGEATCFDAK
jgi:hypothetical protein